MTRHRFSLLILFVLPLLLWVAGCDQDGSDPEQSRQQSSKKVNFFHYFSGSLSGGIDEMVATVNARNPAYTVLASGLDHEAFKTMIPTSLDRGDPPELFSYWAGERVRQLVDKTQLLVIDDLWERENLSASFNRAIVDSAVSYDGRKYLLPITQHVVVFFYNTKILRDLDLLPPQTWPDFLTVCARLQEKGIAPIALGARERWPAQFWFDYLLLRTADPDFRDQLLQGGQSFTDERVVKVFRMWSELLQHGYFNSDANQLDWAEATTLVRQGKAGMTLMGTWATQALEEPPGGLLAERDYDYFPFPVIDPGLPIVAMGPIDGIAISRASENHEYAKEVLAYFASVEAQQIMSSGSGALSPNHIIPDSFYSAFKLRLKMEIDRADRWAFAFDLAAPPAMADRGLDSFNELIAFPAQYRQILDNLQTEIGETTSNR